MNQLRSGLNTPLIKCDIPRVSAVIKGRFTALALYHFVLYTMHKLMRAIFVTTILEGST